LFILGICYQNAYLRGLKNHLHHLFFVFLYSEWVLGTREDLVKDIIAELRPDLGEVTTDSVLLFSFVSCPYYSFLLMGG
jgi:hypothetical protein